MKREIKKQRMQIMSELNALNNRSAAGEDVEAELLRCGDKLKALSGKKSKEIRNDTLNLTDAQKKKASVRGIRRQTIYYRVHILGWTIEKAISHPLMRKSDPNEVGLTIDSYKRLKASGMSDVSIRSKYKISQHMLHKFKSENGLLVRTWKRKKVAQ